MIDKTTAKPGQAMNVAQPHVAIVAEGGGQRGIFTAGVFDAFLEQQFNPFQLGLGVSAGAQNLLSYFMAEQGYARRAIQELTAAPGFFVPYRWLGSRGVIDLDNYFETTLHDPEYRLSYQRISAVQKQRRLLFIATDYEDLLPVYLEPDRQNVVTYLKASSAVPFLYKAHINVAQKRLVDGGVSDPLPIKKAIGLGAKHIVVVRTTTTLTRYSSWRQRIDAMPLRRALPSVLKKMLDVHEAAYSEGLELILNPPTGISVSQIAPEDALQSHAFGSSSEAIVQDYETGLRSGRNAIAKLTHLLTKQDGKNFSTLSDSVTESVTS